MKGLDTPILLGLLHGSASVRALIRTLPGEELATSEINMFELSLLAAHGPKGTASARQKALVGLRRRITVVPIGPDGVQRAAGRRLPLGYAPLIWSAMSAAGCSEWLTTKSCAPPKGSAGMKVRII